MKKSTSPGLDGLGKGWDSNWRDCNSPYAFFSTIIKIWSQSLIICSWKPSNMEFSHYSFWTNTVFGPSVWRTSKRCTLVLFGLHSNCLQHSVPCCVSDLHICLSPCIIFKTLKTVQQNLSGNKSNSCCQCSSLIQLLHIIRSLGRDWRGGYWRTKCQTVQRKPRKCQTLFCCRADISKCVVQLLYLTDPAVVKLIAIWYIARRPNTARFPLIDIQFCNSEAHIKRYIIIL